MNQTYTVKAGDTLYGISNQFGVSVTELASLNNIYGSNLKIGEVLKIPNTAGTNPNNMFMYTVKKGDSLYSIANKYNTTIQKIIDLNYLKSTNLSIGQVLRIPENYTDYNNLSLPNYINYVVKKGDSLYSIARDNNISVDILMKDNSLSNTNLKIGQNLKIRVPSTVDTVLECFGTDYEPSTSLSYTTYTVKKGDSLYSIANNYDTTVTSIKNINNLSSNNLSIGQVLKIPYKSGTETKYYTVKKGDSLYSIANKFGTTIENIKKNNNLSSNILSIGQILKI